MPVTASVTACSTWRRAFSSRKCQAPSGPSRNSTVPAPTYPAARASATAARPRAARSPGSAAGDGASSTIFWWRRWSEQSPLAQVDDGAVGVGEHLHLDVAGAADESLEIDAAVAEGRRGLPPGRCDRIGKRGRGEHRSHPAATAARGRLHHEREAEPERLLLERLVGEVDAGVARRHRDPGRLGQPAGLDLVARGPQCGRRRADEDEPGLGHGLGELGALGQEAVSGVDGVGAGGRRRGDEGLGVEVSRHFDGAVGDVDMERPALGGLVGRDRLDSELPAGARDPNGDLAAVCDQDALESGAHRGFRFSRNAASPSWASGPAQRPGAGGGRAGAGWRWRRGAGASSRRSRPGRTRGSRAPRPPPHGRAGRARRRRARARSASPARRRNGRRS